MAGQDATLTLEQAKKQQERICASGSGSEHQGPKDSSGKHDPICEKVSHQGK